jgi:hypothetical protein
MIRLIRFAMIVGLVSLRAGLAQAEEFGLQQEHTAREAKNSIFVELGGNAGLYSLNYERFLGEDVGLRIGMMYVSVSATATSGTTTTTGSASWFGAPLMFSYLGVGSDNHKLDLGIGTVLMYFSGGTSTFDATAKASGMLVAGTATVGYRYVPANGGFNFKAGFTPLFFQSAGKAYFLPWAGISAGYGF